MSHVRQVPGDRYRRWFCDEALDVVVWYEPDGSIYGFQICYDPQNRPRALTWAPTRGFWHANVDIGEGTGYADRTPMLRPGGVLDAVLLRKAFAETASGLPAAEREFIEGKLADMKG